MRFFFFGKQCIHSLQLQRISRTRPLPLGTKRSPPTHTHKTSKKKQKQKTKASPPPFFAVLFSPSLRLSSALLQQELIDEGGPGLDDAPDGRSNEPEHSLLQGVQHGPHKRDVLDEAAHGPVVLVLHHSTLQ